MTAFPTSLGFVALAEMGDKTQLATITLAAKYQAVIPVLAGTTTGTLIADGIGIRIGIILGKKIPEKNRIWREY